jgi:hypothetical protein
MGVMVLPGGSRVSVLAAHPSSPCAGQAVPCLSSGSARVPAERSNLQHLVWCSSHGCVGLHCVQRGVHGVPSRVKHHAMLQMVQA